jgi:hypothetical protein
MLYGLAVGRRQSEKLPHSANCFAACKRNLTRAEALGVGARVAVLKRLSSRTFSGPK